MSDEPDDENQPKPSKGVDLDDLSLGSGLPKAIDETTVQRAMEAAFSPSLKRTMEMLDSPSMRLAREMMNSPSAHLARATVNGFANSSYLEALNSSSFMQVMEAQRKRMEELSGVFAAATMPSETILENMRQMADAARFNFGGLAASLLANAVPRYASDPTGQLRSSFDEIGSAARSALEAARLPQSTVSSIAATAGITGALMGSIFGPGKFPTLQSVDTSAFADMAALGKFESLFESVRRQQEEMVGPLSAMGRILRQLDERREHWSSLTKVGMTGALAASLAASGLNPTLGSSLTDVALVIAEARRTIADDALWREASEQSVLVEGVAAFSGVEAERGPDIGAVLDALERHTERIVAMLAQATSPARRLHLYDYVMFILTLVQTLVAIIAFYPVNGPSTADEENHDITPEIAERLDKNVTEPLTRAAEETVSQVAGMRFVVCKVRTRALVRQAPTTKAKAVGSMLPGEKATVISEAEGWIEVEFVEPVSGEIVRGWVFGRLLAKLTVPSE